MLLAPIRGNAGHRKEDDLCDAKEGWAEFVATTSTCYGVDMGCLSSAFAGEQEQYYLQTGQWSDLSPQQLLGPPVVLASYDLNTVQLADIQRPTARFTMTLEGCGEHTPVDGFAGWFDVAFAGSVDNPATERIELDTSPCEAGSTHWGQQAFYLHPSQAAAAGDVMVGEFEMARCANRSLFSTYFSVLF